MASKRAAANSNLPIQAQPAVTFEEKEDLVIHMLRFPRIYEAALAQTKIADWKEDDDQLRVVVTACNRLIKKGVTPAQTGFRAKLKQEARLIAGEQAHDEVVAEAAAAVAAEDGFIDRAFRRHSSRLSEDMARPLLRRVLVEQTVLRPMKVLFDECGYDGQFPKDFGDVLNILVTRLRAVDGVAAAPGKTLAEEWADHRRRLEPFRGRGLIGLRTGLAELDRRTLGLRGLFFLGAKPGAGKTTYAAVQIAIGVCRHAAENDSVVVVVSLDMCRFDLYRRVDSHLGEVEWSVLMFGSPEKTRAKNSHFSPAHQKAVARAEKRLTADQVGDRLTVLDRGTVGEEATALRLRSAVQVAKAKAGARRALVIIDYLQLLPVPDDVLAAGDLAADKYRVRLVQQLIEGTQTDADPLGDTALVISEARKPPNKKEVWGDSMSELMGSARIGYAGDAVLLYREMTAKEIQGHYAGVHDAGTAERKRAALRDQGISPVMLILDKGRDGMLRGAWGTEFLFRRNAFRELPTKAAAVLPPPTTDRDADSKYGEPVEVSSAKSGQPLPLPPSGPGKKSKCKSETLSVNAVAGSRKVAGKAAGKKGSKEGRP
jgi:replicative DNA helicase